MFLWPLVFLVVWIEIFSTGQSWYIVNQDILSHYHNVAVAYVLRLQWGSPSGPNPNSMLPSWFSFLGYYSIQELLFIVETIAYTMTHQVPSIYLRVKYTLQPWTCAKVWFSTFNYETGQETPSNYQNRTTLVLGRFQKRFSIFGRRRNFKLFFWAS